ncbi:MAG: thioredoxin domain-containing protein [Betaproteobacteria bacterium]|nr:thioredoxin domain-containing protein [Betaproteobacteria bacterium]
MVTKRSDASDRPPAMWQVGRYLVMWVIVLVGIVFQYLPAAAGENPTTQPVDAAKQHAHTNHLIDSNDPYLLLHAHNPVDWYPWGAEALVKAKRENRPIFVSIGYSTCYWCHVAERIIYSDPEIAKLMNEWFVNIKVDREQRPDLDSIYMLATQLITGRGGWPNNVFLTPDLKPFYAGSYFPPADDELGRPGFPTRLKALHEAWVNRPQEVLNQADKVYQAMLEARKRTAAETMASISPTDWLSSAREAILQDYDATYGGLGSGPTKFPREPALTLLLADREISRHPQALAALTKTLDAMALGGIHDHLSGGFHRYSTEPTWSIPHFEKMLYDNAQLLGIYAEAYRITHNALYRQVAEDVADYLSREMMARGGGFYAAQDAEVAGREGISYLWNQREIESILGEEAAKRFFLIYALTPLPEPHGNSLLAGAEGGVLRVRMPIAEALQRSGGNNISQVLASLAPARAQLLEARNRRIQPARDEKIIVAWNGMTIVALVQSGAILQNERFIGLAKQTADRLWQQAFDPKTGELKHELFGGRAQIHGYLDDYALLGIAFLSLADATKEGVWRDRAAQLANSMLRRFLQGDTLTTSMAASDLLIPPLDDGDHTAPTGTSAAIELLVRMHRVTRNQEYADAALRVVTRLSGMLQEYPSQWPSAVAALNRYPLPVRSVAKRDTPSRLARTPSALPGTAEHVHAVGKIRSTGNHDEIRVTVVIDEGYHVNANPATFDYLIPTSLSVDGVPDLRVEYPAATLIKPQFAPDGLNVYEGSISLKGVAPKGTLLRHDPIVATLRVQACDDEVCLPPSTLSLNIKRP